MNAMPSVVISSSPASLTLAHKLALHLETVASVSLWSREIYSGRSPIEALSRQLSNADFAIMIVSYDDALSRPGSDLFEVGLAVGALGSSRVELIADSRRTLLIEHPPSLPSDFVELPIHEVSPNSTREIERAGRLIAGHIAAAGWRRDASPSPPSVFLSYAQSDVPFVRRLYSDLVRAGISCWLDVKTTRTGLSWGDEVAKAIRLTDRMLFIVSVYSLDDQSAQAELAVALDRESRGCAHRDADPTRRCDLTVAKFVGAESFRLA